VFKYIRASAYDISVFSNLTTDDPFDCKVNGDEVETSNDEKNKITIMIVIRLGFIRGTVEKKGRQGCLEVQFHTTTRSP